jgi:predicted nucleic acid-binding protein
VTTLVLDASVVVKWVLADSEVEAHTQQALAILDALRSERVSVVQPVHWLAEVAAVLTRLIPRQAREVITLLHAIELPVWDGAEIYDRACDLALRCGEHVFDTLYHAVALAHPDAFLVTADERYVRGAARYGRVTRLHELSLSR